MTRTAPGQSWTAHNTATRILFGRVLPTVGIDNTAFDRRFYINTLHADIKAGSKAGGARLSSANTNTVVQSGGSWRGGNRACSWMAGGDLFIGGSHAAIDAGALGAGYALWECALSGPALAKAKLPGHAHVGAFRHTVLCVAKALSGFTATYKLLRFAAYQTVEQKPLNAFSLVLIDSRQLLVLDLDMSGNQGLFAGDYVTGFDGAAKRLGVLLQLVSSGTVTQQTVKLITTQDGFDTWSIVDLSVQNNQHLYTTDVQTMTGTSVPPDWMTSRERNRTLVAGTPRMLALKMEQKTLAALRVNISNFSGALTDSAARQLDGSNGPNFSRATHSSGGHSEKLELVGIDFSGVLTVLAATPAIASADSSDFTADIVDGDAAVSFSASSAGLAYVCHDFSYESGFVLADMQSVLDDAAATGSGTPETYASTGTGDTQTGYDYRLMKSPTEQISLLADSSQVIASQGVPYPAIPDPIAFDNAFVSTAGNSYAVEPQRTALTQNGRLLIFAFNTPDAARLPKTLLSSLARVDNYQLVDQRLDIDPASPITTGVALSVDKF